MYGAWSQDALAGYVQGMPALPPCLLSSAHGGEIAWLKEQQDSFYLFVTPLLLNLIETHTHLYVSKNSSESSVIYLNVK